MPDRDGHIIEWLTLGRPHPLAEPRFAKICWRDCQFIWHKVSLLLQRNSSGIARTPTLTGSRFPTHAVCIDNVHRVSMSQAAIGNL